MLLTTNYQLTKSSDLQTNFCFMPRAQYIQVSFSNFSNLIHYSKIWEPMKNEVEKEKSRQKKNKKTRD